jgi:hypothetical protein
MQLLTLLPTRRDAELRSLTHDGGPEPHSHLFQVVLHLERKPIELIHGLVVICSFIPCSTMAHLNFNTGFPCFT